MKLTNTLNSSNTTLLLKMTHLRLGLLSLTMVVGFYCLASWSRRSQATGRVVSSTYVVTNSSDSGVGSLRQAILDANAAPGFDAITFNIGFGVQTITPLTPLPAITDPVSIDASTQPGFSGSPIIELNGQIVGQNFNMHGLIIESGFSSVKGLVINRFSGHGIAIRLNGGNVIQGNYIGVDINGVLDRGNGGDGVNINNVGGNTIGGTSPSARNVLSGNNDDGVELFESGASNNLVQGNFIGCDATGSFAIRNTNKGIRIQLAPNNTIGGTVAGAGNVISGNGAPGIDLVGGGTTGTVIQGNYIGTKADGIQPLPNGNSGITTSFLGAFPSNNMIGGTEIGAGNVIAHNGDHGILISCGIGNAIRGNRIFNNDLGIELWRTVNGPGGVILNDQGDSDTGANNLQNFPVLSSALTQGAQTTVQGQLNSTPNGTFQLDFFANSTCDSSGYGEGETYIGSRSVVTDGQGDISFTFTFPAVIEGGEFITATATNAQNDTSEFSSCVQVISNEAPVASCQSITKSANNNCQATVTPQEVNNGSFDPDGNSLSLVITPAGPYPVGVTPVTLTVTDDKGASSSCTTVITVVDNTPPNITAVSATPAQLSPPNHQMIDVVINYLASDNCTSQNSCVLSVTSNESSNTTDWEIVDSHHVRLRAERSGKGNGRIYTIAITCTDAAGNQSTTSVNVTVPK